MAHPDDVKKQRAERAHARGLRRQELRTAALAEHPGVICLDGEHLLQRANAGEVNSKGNVVRRALVVRALLAARYTVPEIAAAWNTTVTAVTEDAERPLLDTTGLADAIEKQLTSEYPDVAPTLARPALARS